MNCRLRYPLGTYSEVPNNRTGTIIIFEKKDHPVQPNFGTVRLLNFENFQLGTNLVVPVRLSKSSLSNSGRDTVNLILELLIKLPNVLYKNCSTMNVTTYCDCHVISFPCSQSPHGYHVMHGHALI